MVTREKYLDFLETGKLDNLLCYEEVSSGDVFFIPAGRVHAIGKGILLAEIQQISDVTYRIFDYNRKDANGIERELHTELALDAITFDYMDEYKTRYETKLNQSSEIVICQYFTTSLLEFDNEIDKNYNQLDSFIIYMTLEGEYDVIYSGGVVRVSKGETVLIPASLESYRLKPVSKKIKTLEIYIG